MSSIIVKNLVLDYPIRNRININKKSDSSVGGRIIEKNGEPYLRAIDDICLEINSGDRVGVIGHNGAGKSTLLKTLGGIYKPTSGSVDINGKVAPLFNLKFGMDMELSGYENIVLRALYLGVPRREILQKRDEIAILSDLGDFLYLPMKSYSSGMIARLAFAVSVKIDADILLLDEMIGTGDANFINKTSEMAKGFVESSNILLLASHSNKVIREICNKAIVFEHGKIVDFTDVDDALNTYKFKSILSNNCNNKLSPRNQVNKKDSRLSSYLLVNDTSTSDNLGCQAVKKSISMILDKNSYCEDSIPLGYGVEYFKELSSKSSEWIDKSDDFPKYKDYTSQIKYDDWLRAKNKLKDNDVYLDKVTDVDYIVINAEGSIHHNSARGLALLAQASIYAEIKPVFMLNCSIFNMDEQILKDCMDKVSVVHSREGFTYKYLKNHGIESVYSPDLASLYINTLTSSSNINEIIVGSEPKLCLISLGVLATPKKIKEVIDIVRSRNLTPVYLSMSDGNEDMVSYEVCSEMVVKRFVAKDIELENSIQFLSQFETIISGRHHLNIFALCTEAKLICLPSNTLKVEGTLGFISKIRPMAYSMVDLKDLLDSERYDLPLSSVKSFAKSIQNDLVGILNESIKSI
ncbi:ABC transporter ATP-binding protein [Vibrio coralliirubri]|uniref:ABC transporter ATP-binding protein n=1 Tax=Vibrio coralliirubri TaxID=1516159 RepID=UPI000EFBE9AF|nr:ABC transporter ATP-binding protein [Vibrio coralliirubri]